MYGVRLSLKGNPVGIRDGPAAVIGNEGCKMPLANGREGAAGRKIRKSEDLPLQIIDQAQPRGRRLGLT